MFVECKDIGTLVKYVTYSLTNELYDSLNESGYLRNLIIERFGEQYAIKHSMSRIHWFPIDSVNSNYRHLYIIEYRKPNPDMLIADGYYTIDNTLIKVVSINLSIYEANEVTYKDLSVFFSYLREICNDIVDTDFIRMNDKIALSVYMAMNLISKKFNLNKNGFIKIMEQLPEQKRYIKDSNTLFENFSHLSKAGELSYNKICRAFEEGMESVPSNKV